MTEHDEQILLEKVSRYETALQNIASITRVESPLDQSAEMFFMVASKMRKIAKKALESPSIANNGIYIGVDPARIGSDTTIEVTVENGEIVCIK